MYRMQKQPVVYHRELYSISCDKNNENVIEKRIYIYIKEAVILLYSRN